MSELDRSIPLPPGGQRSPASSKHRSTRGIPAGRRLRERRRSPPHRRTSPGAPAVAIDVRVEKWHADPRGEATHGKRRPGARPRIRRARLRAEFQDPGWDRHGEPSRPKRRTAPSSSQAPEDRRGQGARRDRRPVDLRRAGDTSGPHRLLAAWCSPCGLLLAWSRRGWARRGPLCRRGPRGPSSAATTKSLAFSRRYTTRWSRSTTRTDPTSSPPSRTVHLIADSYRDWMVSHGG